MRVALLTDIFTPMLNGVVNHVCLLQQELEAMGHEAWVVTPGPANDDDGDHVLRYGGLPLGSTGYFAGWPLDDHLWTILRAADVLHTHHPFLSGALALTASRMSGAPVVFTNHTRYDIYTRVYVPYVPPFLADPPMYAWLRRVCDQCAAVIAPSAGVAEIMQTWGIREQVNVISNGIRLDHFTNAHAAALELYGVPPGSVVALYLGRIGREKAVVPLLEAFRTVAAIDSRPHLLFVGEGAQAEELQLTAQEWGLEARVHFAGSVPYGQVPAMMAAADFFVSASISEAHPLVFVEAAAAGLPTLGVRSPGISDTVIDGVTGLLAPDTGDEFVQHFLTLSADAALRARLGQAAREHSSRYSARATAEATAAIYAQALERSRLQS